MPSLPYTLDADFGAKKTCHHGSATGDGTQRNYFTNVGNWNTRVYDTYYGIWTRKEFAIAHGAQWQDERPPDKRIEPVMGPEPQYSWRNRLANVASSKMYGNMFKLPPQGTLVAPPEGGLTRGGMFPQIVFNAPGPMNPNQVPVTNSNSLCRMP